MEYTVKKGHPEKVKEEKKENLKIIENKNVRLQDLPYIMHT